MNDKNSVNNMLVNKNIKDVYSLSSMQKGMFFHWMLEKESETYFEQYSLCLKGDVDIERVREAICIIIRRYEVLRNIFIINGMKEPRQIVLKEVILPFTYEDISKERKKYEYLRNYKDLDRKKGFELTKEVAIRISILKIENERYEIIWSFHHIIMDGWCIGIILKDFFKVYEALSFGKKPILDATYPYSDYVKWLMKKEKEPAYTYWKEYLKGYEEQSSLPKDTRGSAGKSYKNAEVSLVVSELLTKKIETLTRKKAVTLNTVLQAVWGILLQRYNNREDVVFGSVVSGRPAEVKGIESMVGLFINTIPVRVVGSNTKSFIELLYGMQNAAISSAKYDYVELAKIQAQSALKQNLLDHIMVFENYPIEREASSIINKDRINFEIESIDVFEQTNYDFNIVVVPGNEIQIFLRYNENIYENELISRVAGHIEKVLETIAEEPEVLIKDIDILTEEEQRKILYNFNDTEAEYPKDKTIYELFEEQVERTPNNVALIFKDKQLTYDELNKRANSIAWLLREKGVGPETIVGIMVERSFEMIIGIMGILKAGGAYLPLDVSQPVDRKRYMIKDCNVDIILTKKYTNDIALINCEYIYLDDEALYSENVINIKDKNIAHSLAYIMYTSGSTGNPKGVMVEHRNVVNYITWSKKVYEINEQEVFPLYSSIAFDLTVTSIFTPLILGSRIIIYQSNKDENELYKIMRENQCTIIKLTPSHLFLIKDIDNTCSRIKKLIVGGEDLKVDLADAIYKCFGGNIEIYNEYGPTETVVGCMIHKYDYKHNNRISVPIGVPADNVQIYLLDQNLKNVPMCVVGEICVSGDGVTRGYLNKPEDTAENFVLNPYKENERLYHTGDLGRRLLDGKIEYLGRKDTQIKIRGFRVELREVEIKIRKCEDIKDSVVIDRADDNGDKYLCAYIVAENEIDERDIRSQLKKTLPDYMIPSYFVKLDKMPLTSNGKINMKALPKPNRNLMIEEYVEASTEIETMLVEIWKEVLDVEKIGVTNNFFDMGGHSLKFMLLLGKISRKIKIEVSFEEIFRRPTIRDMSKYITIQLMYRNNQTFEPIRGENYCLMTISQYMSEIQKDIESSLIKKDDTVILLNKKNKFNVFAFPPIDAYGIVYTQLANKIDSYSFYAFDFIENEERIIKYADIIIDIQQTGSYILLGHSSGGRLAFEVAKELEKRGKVVSGIIMLDTTVCYKKHYIDESLKKEIVNNITEEIDEYIGANSKQIFEKIQQIALEKIANYLKYDSELITDGIIHSSINIIEAMVEDKAIETNKLLSAWSNHTCSTLNRIKGVGSHIEMINSCNVESNSCIVKQIISKLIT